MNSPFSSIGVWQSPHCPIAFTRYSPWAICCLLGSLARGGPAIGRYHNTAQPGQQNHKCQVFHSPSRKFLEILQYRRPLFRLQNWMGETPSLDWMTIEQDQRIAQVVKREQSRLRNFIRRRVPDPRDAEDILQEVFYELVEANRLLMPIEHVTGWLFRVARNRITDLFRKKKPESFSDAAVADEEGELLQLEDLLPSPDSGPDALYARSLLLEELESALDELPDEQREVFVGHEIEGRSFKQMAAETGVSVNTLLSRKRYAVLHLRERLQSIYDEFTKA
jgi:RNA polymerase sigma factor (sigma-70 family)